MNKKELTTKQSERLRQLVFQREQINNTLMFYVKSLADDYDIPQDGSWELDETFTYFIPVKKEIEKDEKDKK